MTKEIKTVEEFKEVIKTTCIVDFYMDDCPNCRAMDTVIESLDVDIPIYKFKIDMKISAAIRNICTVMGAPTISIFNNSIEKFRNVGFMNKDEFKDVILVYC